MEDIINVVLVPSDALILIGLGIAIVLLVCLFRDHSADSQKASLKDNTDPRPERAPSQSITRPR